MRILLVALLAVAANACATGTIRYINIYNTAHDSVTSFAVAAVGSDDFREIPLGSSPLRGGGDSTTIGIRGDGCLRDFRIVFGNRRTLIHKDYDVCKYRNYHTGEYMRWHAQETRKKRLQAEASLRSP